MAKAEKYLPVGTVVKLINGTKKAMITGFASTGDTDNKVYDYNGCLYPEGFLSSNQVCLFNHNQIETIYFLGYVDEDEKCFKEELNKVISQMYNSQKETEIETHLYHKKGLWFGR